MQTRCSSRIRRVHQRSRCTLVIGLAIGRPDRLKGSVSGISECNHPPAEPLGREVKHLPGSRLVHDACLATADPEVGGCQHDRHRHLSEVVLHDLSDLRICVAIRVLWVHECDCRRRISDPRRALPGLREPGDDARICAEDEGPELTIRPRRRAPRRLQDLVQCLGRQRLIGECSYVPARSDGIPCLHRASQHEGRAQ
jgi:hypothetical protein